MFSSSQDNVYNKVSNTKLKKSMIYELGEACIDTWLYIETPHPLSVKTCFTLEGRH